MTPWSGSPLLAAETYRLRDTVGRALGMGYPPPLRVDLDTRGQLARAVCRLPAGFQPDQTATAERYLNVTLGPCELVWDWAAGDLTIIPVAPREVPTECWWDRAPPAAWHLLRVGENAEGPVYWDLLIAAHLLICGGSGSGKSTAFELLLEQALAAGWQAVCYDPKLVELIGYSGRDGVLAVETQLARIADSLEWVTREQARRYMLMVEHRVNHWAKLPTEVRPAPLLVAFDEIAAVLRPVKAAGDVAAVGDNRLRGRVGQAVTEVAERGRAAGVHELFAAQGVRADWFDGSIQRNMLARLHCGTTDDVTSRLFLGNSKAGVPFDPETGLGITPGVVGRAAWYVRGEVSEVQVSRVPEAA